MKLLISFILLFFLSLGAQAGVPQYGVEKEFDYNGSPVRLRWEMEPFSGNLQLVAMTKQGGNAEWWITSRLGPVFNTETAKRYPGGCARYIQEVVLPSVNDQIEALVAKAKADNERDPVNGVWESSYDQLNQLLLRSLQVQVNPDGTWQLIPQY